MEPLGIEKVVEITQGRVLSGVLQGVVYSVYTDSRTEPEQGAMFVPLAGENFDGHNFIESVSRKKGVLGAFTSRDDIECDTQDFVLIKVDDTLCALQQIAAWNRKTHNIPVIGITGSAGKTTTKEILGAITSLAGNSVVSKASFNNHIGVPLTLLNINSETEFAVVEMGMNAAGEIRNLASLAAPDIAVITNAGPCHLEALGSVKGVAKAKAEIIESLGADGVLVINGDDSVLCDIAVPIAEKKGVRIIRFGLNGGNDFQAVRVKTDGAGISYCVQSNMLEAPVDISAGLEGTHNVLNSLAAFAAAWMSGFGLDEICEGIKQARSAKMRWEEKKLKETMFILDCYNANPLAVKCGLETLSQKHAKDRKIFVFGNMYELGKDCDNLHRQVGVQMADNGIEVALLVGDFACLAGSCLEKRGYSKENIIKCSNNKQAAKALAEIVKPNDVVYFKGSRMSKMEEIFDIYSKSIETGKVGQL